MMNPQSDDMELKRVHKKLKAKSSKLKAVCGFTLIELIVAVGVFGIAATFAIGSLITLTGAQRKAAATQNAFDNIRFALEAISKEMRTGEDYVNPCGSKVICNQFRYTNADGDTIRYRLSGTTIQKRIDPPVGPPGQFQNLTDTRIRVEQLEFYIDGENNSPPDGEQPLVTIVIHAVAEKGRPRNESRIHLQTTVTPRKLQPDSI